MKNMNKIMIIFVKSMSLVKEIKIKSSIVNFLMKSELKSTWLISQINLLVNKQTWKKYLDILKT